MNNLFRFGDFVLDSRRRMLSRADSPVFLTPKAFDVLLFLVQHPNRLVTKEELLRAVWSDTFVEEGNLAQHVSHLRKALGDNADDVRLIVTIARKGYQFTATVSVDEEEADVAIPAIPRRWWKSALVLSSVVVVLGAGYGSWRSLRASGTPRSQKIRLAVLPFQNLTGDPNKEYLADGLTEEMISQLGRVNQDRLGVIARTSVMGYKHKDARLDEIGRDLSVDYVLESSLRASGDRLRFTAQLIQVKDQTHLWSKDYDYAARDILSVEDDVAKAIAQEIRLRLTSPQQPSRGQSYPANPEAFEAYLQGFYFFQRNTAADSEMAAKFYERAIELDPSYALAWVGLSRVRQWQANTSLIPKEEGHRVARQAVERALALNPNLAAAHAQMGRIKQQVDFDWVGADASIQRMIALEPENPESQKMAGFSASMFGRFEEALRLDRRAIDLDPLNAESWQFLAQTEFFEGQLAEAEADVKKAIELNRDIWPGDILLSQVYVMQQRPRDALSVVDRVRYDLPRMFLNAIAYHALGRKRESDDALSQLIAKYPSSMFQIAQVYAFRNQPDEAFEWLGRAYAGRDSGLIGTRVDPLLTNLHRDPRYAALLKKLNF